MFNLIKFEMLKRKKMFSILGTLFLLMQVFIIYKTSILTTTDNDLIDKGGLLVFITYIVFIFSSLLTFSKDINSVDRSLVFMTPYSGFTIVSSKFLTTIISGTALVLTTIIWLIANAYYIAPQSSFQIDGFFQDGAIISGFKILALTYVSIGSFFSLVFLSIIITKTFLSKLKFKTLIVIIVMSVLSKIFNLVFLDNLNEVGTINFSMSTIIIVLITTLMLWISGWLIDNKTDF
ncbi:hypothetical protein [Psychrilyobacter atlanticus]|uniref:hypothetical protein n=1 Tax=Psychrilyobacter atlanticus TaxID=271091 RepID=UPI0004276B16|nr:hypothetical protein [Psychrilyobacter atlanticus]